MHAGGEAGAGSLFELREPRWPEALAHYYFAAAGNDSAARMALGYRHMHGLGVPKSCQAALLYYQPVAEHVVELTRLPNVLPVVNSFSSVLWHPAMLMARLFFMTQCSETYALRKS